MKNKYCRKKCQTTRYIPHIMRFINNAGGNSVISEIFSYTYLEKYFGAKLINTEMELQYHNRCSIVDYSVTIANKTYGCSVTRCFNYINLKASVEQSKIDRLLNKKIRGLYSANENIIGQPWDGLILHIIVPNSKIMTQISNTLKQYDETIGYIITIANYPVLYFEKPSHIPFIVKHGITQLDTMKCLMPKQYCHC